MSVVRKPASFAGGFFVFMLMFAFVGVIGSCAITIGIWPGEIKLLAPFFCTDAQPDAFVVADTYSPRPGETVTNFSLYCMGPRGDATDHGFMKPFLLISVFNGIVIMSFFGIIGLLFGMRSRRRLKALSNRSTFVDDDPFASSPVIDNNDDDDDSPVRTAAPPGSTAGPFVD